MPSTISMNEYIDLVNSSLKVIADKEQAHLKKCGEILADAVKKDKRIHIFGTGGASFIFALESFYRPGTLPQVNPFFEQGFMNSHGAMKARMLQNRVVGYGEAVLDYYRISKGDVLIIVNTYGINKASIEAAVDGSALGATVIGVSSKNLSQFVPANHPDRHKSGKSISDLPELSAHIDLHISSLTASGGIGGMETPVLSFVANSLVSFTIDASEKKGNISPLWMDEYSSGGFDNNRKLEQKYRNTIRHL